MTAPFSSDSLTTIALDAIVTGLEQVEQTMRELDAERVRLLAEAFDLAAVEGEEAGHPESHLVQGSRGELALRAVRAEIAAALHVSERTVERQLTHAHTLTWQYPTVLEALRDGRISARHAAVISDAGRPLGAGDDAPTVWRRGEYAEAVLEHATASTPAALSARARRIAEHFAETPLDERHAQARRERRVWVEDRDDGMAELRAHLPAVEAYAVKDRLTRAARAVDEAECAAGSRTDRCRDEIRADVLTDLLLNGEIPNGEIPSANSCGGNTASSGLGGVPPRSPERLRTVINPIRAVVQVIVPAARLATDDPPPDTPSRGTSPPDTSSRGAGPPSAESPSAESPDDDPPELIGYGPIDGATARDLAGNAHHWERIFADAGTGNVLSVDRYRPSEQMRRVLRARDVHCRFPGCRMPAHRCDIDHTVDAQHGGSTSLDNLAHLCRGHHTIKHHTGWRVVQHENGHLKWFAPSGRSYDTHPPRQKEQQQQQQQRQRASRVRFTEPPPDHPTHRDRHGPREAAPF